MDSVDRHTRSRMMAGIRGRNTRPEIIVRSLLHREGLRFRLHDPKLPGRPDIVMKARGVIVFVHGCYWHRHRNCKNATIPQSNRAFWVQKLQSNVRRDRQNIRDLVTAGWRVLVVWECAIREAHGNTGSLRKAICRWLASKSQIGEIG